MKTALDLAGVTGFPYKLSPMKTKTALPILDVFFTKAAPSLKNKNLQPNRVQIVTRT